MSLALPFAIGAVVIVTSIISGIFGMAGGLILMLILSQFLAVQAAMVLHGITQFFSNGWRAVMWRQWIDWRIIGLYTLGALPAILLPLVFAYVPSKPTMLILLGLVPYVALADRRAVVATKAATQALSHTLKVGYYGVLLSQAPKLGLDVYGAAIVAAVIGTTLAGPVLEKMSNENFRRWTKTIVLIVGTISIAQGVWLILAPH